jgi:RNA polymerase sigma-70 factor (ECF subfamily)
VAHYEEDVAKPSAIRLVSGARSTPVESMPDTHDMAQVFRQFAPYVGKIGLRILGDADEADDLVQDVFLDAYKGIRNLRDTTAIRFWLASIAVRKAKRRLRKRALLRTLGLDRPVDPSLAADSTNVEERAGLLAVYRILDGVPADARIAWVLHRVEGESLERTAELCGCSRATAHRRIRVAQLALGELTDVET